MQGMQMQMQKQQCVELLDRDRQWIKSIGKVGTWSLLDGERMTGRGGPIRATGRPLDFFFSLAQ